MYSGGGGQACTLLEPDEQRMFCPLIGIDQEAYKGIVSMQTYSYTGFMISYIGMRIFWYKERYQQIATLAPWLYYNTLNGLVPKM